MLIAFICFALIALLSGWGLIGVLIVGVVLLVGYFAFVILMGALVAHKNDKEGYKIEKRTRYRRKTYDDGFGKYTVNIREEEWVRVPKDQNK